VAPYVTTSLNQTLYIFNKLFTHRGGKRGASDMRGFGDKVDRLWWKNVGTFVHETDDTEN